jgi:hypothetical protein
MSKLLRAALLPWLVIAACALGAFLLGAGMLNPAHSQEGPGCLASWSEAYAGAEKDGYDQIEVIGADKDRFVANYNAIEPRSDWNPEHVWLAIKAGEDEVSFAFVTGDCMLNAEATTVEQVREMLTKHPKDDI